jgi:hypothetical protein
MKRLCAALTWRPSGTTATPNRIRPMSSRLSTEGSGIVVMNIGGRMAFALPAFDFTIWEAK